jgi:hypothetical protein
VSVTGKRRTNNKRWPLWHRFAADDPGQKDGLHRDSFFETFGERSTVVKKALLLMALLGIAAPALAGPAIVLPPGWVNFDGNGYFDQSIPGSFDADGPLPVPIGAELFGVGTISDVAMVSDLAHPVWWPTDVGPNYEMTYTFFDAVVVKSSRTITPDPVHPDQWLVDLDTWYSDEARLLFVSDINKDGNSTPGPVLFDTTDGEYPTFYTLGAHGPVDPGESLYLDLMLSSNSSTVRWSSWAMMVDPASFGFLGGRFTGFFVEINGGYGASQFIDYVGSDGTSDGFVTEFYGPPGWAYGADTDVKLHAVPEPAALMSLCAGLALLAATRCEDGRSSEKRTWESGWRIGRHPLPYVVRGRFAFAP